MRFSLITVSYNSAATICDTIESVLSQTYLEIEYIIIDGLSKDNTITLIKEYEPLFKGRLFWISEKDNGLYDAMNKGLKMATGDVIGLLNSDDLFASSFAVENVMSYFEQNSSIDAVYADLYYVSQNDTNKIVRHWVTGEKHPFSKGWHPAHPTFYVKKEIYTRLGCFDLSYKLAADFELMLRFIEKGGIKLAYLKLPLVRMRLGGATSKNLKNIREGNLECIKAFRNNGISISRLYPIYRLLPKLYQFIRKR